jgi:hypothetical protein
VRGSIDDSRRSLLHPGGALDQEFVLCSGQMARSLIADPPGVWTRLMPSGQAQLNSCGDGCQGYSVTVSA